MEEAAPAKINLALHVTGERGDGYHLLDSLVVFTTLADHLTVAPSTDLALSIRGELAQGVPPGPDNLVLRAAALVAKGRGARITLDKVLPHAAGLGGGSADAAATLRVLSRLWDLPMPPPAEVLALGADVPVCVASRPQRMQGIGEVLSEVPPLPGLHVVLVNPRVAVSTGAVFRGLAHKANPPMQAPAWEDFAGFIDWLSRQRNDLEPPAIAVAPVVGQVLAALHRRGTPLARMSGSGATCFGLFETAGAAEAATHAIASAHPDWWVTATEIQRA